MKARRHHNNKGHRQIRRGKTAKQVEIMAWRLGLPYRIGDRVKVTSGPLKGEYVCKNPK